MVAELGLWPTECILLWSRATTMIALKYILLLTLGIVLTLIDLYLKEIGSGLLMWCKRLFSKRRPQGKP